MPCDRIFRRNRRTIRQDPRVRPLDAALKEWHQLRNQVKELHNLLDKQRQEFFIEKNQISQELEDTKQQLAKQISLKKKYINREKKTKRELEKVKTCADPQTLNASNVAVQVSETKRQKRKREEKILQQNALADQTSFQTQMEELISMFNNLSLNDKREDDCCAPKKRRVDEPNKEEPEGSNKQQPEKRKKNKRPKN
ncbi:hypothetical protein ABVT39_003633 [Epinephelus coioides]